jgi:altronate hydrolase
LEKIGGKSLVTGVLEYGETADSTPGVRIVPSPPGAAAVCTSMAGSGCQIILFASDGGTPFGCVVPTVKISSATETAARYPGWTDFDAGTVLSGEPPDDAAGRLTEYVLSVAGGEYTAHEKKGYGEIAIFREG